MNDVNLKSEALGLRIRKYRKEKGLTQGKLAEKVGISLSFMGHIERGTRILSIETLIRIAKCLDASIDDMLQDSLPIRKTIKDGYESEFINNIKDVIQVYEENIGREEY